MKVSRNTTRSNSSSSSSMKRSSNDSLVNISVSDKVFVDFCRCLYQAKAVVRDLELLSDSVFPALSQHPMLLYDDQATIKYNGGGDGLLYKQVNQYLNTTFRKFTRLCKILMVVLTQMESSSVGKVKRERIDSFRYEVWEEWKTATSIKQRLIHFTQQSDFQDHTVHTTTTTTTTTTTLTAEDYSTTTTSTSSSATTSL